MKNLPFTLLWWPSEEIQKALTPPNLFTNLAGGDIGRMEEYIYRSFPEAVIYIYRHGNLISATKNQGGES